MTYLLSQIFVSLLLAAVAGGALGWILHGLKAHRRERELSGLINRHASALTQAQQERQMIADDYDEMKLGLESRIGELQLENRKLPELEDNLEKSQQLVQQMMKSHASEQSETQSQSEQLRLELDNLRVQQKNDHSEISALRKTNAELGGNNNLGVSSSPGTSNHSSHIQSDRDSSEEAASVSTSAVATGTGTSPIDESALSAAATQAELMELESEIEEMRGYNRDHSVPAVDVSDHKASAGAAKAAIATAAAGTAAERGTASRSQESSDPKNRGAETSPVNAAGPVSEGSSDNPAQTPTQSPAELRNRFQSSSRIDEADDLQTIHGIGPVIEKSLNDLGIVNYRQIAELTRREVEEIADILEIFPGRIERDNWIGTARKLAGESKSQTTDNKNMEVKDTEVRKEIVSPALQAEEV